ncbi:MAG: Rpn family recombination-promoting nuclease/putative transposase [Desulfovibrio sp.]|nr:Rpn family recombination-promoting nuclease/putative transposase [Desulfovibrio sp.]
MERKKIVKQVKKKRTGKKPHDATYKLLFSQPALFSDFLRCFVPIASGMGIGYGTLEKISGSYITSHLSERTDDIV